MIRRLIILLVSCLPVSAIAETTAETWRHRVTFSGSLTSSDTYSLEASYHYMLCPYVGVGGAFGYWANYFDDGWASGRNWNIDEDDNKPSNLYLRPSVILKSPALKYRSAAWSLYAEPGIMLNVPYQRVCIEHTANWPRTHYDYVGTTKGQWLAAELRAGISLDMGPFGISAGYLISNLDIFSQYRHLSYRGQSFSDFYPSKPLMQGAFLAATYRF